MMTLTDLIVNLNIVSHEGYIIMMAPMTPKQLYYYCEWNTIHMALDIKNCGGQLD